MAIVKRSLDKDLEKIVHVEAATRTVANTVGIHGIAVIFLALSAVLAGVTAGVTSDTAMVVMAAVLGGYMALNIGANDVANNVGPAVGSRALTMFGALVIAAVFESAGALLAGGDVVNTISKGIIDPTLVDDTSVFILAMMAALISSALWVNLATFVGAPVSTTHAVVGGVMGAGIAAVGFQLVNWGTMGAIAASWVISPVLGGVIAAGFLAFIKINLIYREDKIAAARRWVPMLVAVMAGAFACYLAIKGFKRVWKPETWMVLAIGAAVFASVWIVMRPLIRRQSEGMENRNQSLRALFRIPLICSAALLSFAHGANDVANAIGPLAAILRAAEFGEISGKVEVPIWIMMIGAFGISLGLFLYGPKLIRMVGDRITKMNPMPRVLRGTVGGDHRDHRVVARAAGELHPHRGRRGVRGRLLPRVLHAPQQAPPRNGPARRSRRAGRRQPPATAGSAAAPQAGAPVTLPDDHRGLGDHGARDSDPVGARVLRNVHVRLGGITA